MKQTAVEWLIETLAEKGILHSSDIAFAKNLEKEQIGNAYVYGNSFGIDLEKGLTPHNYYNETYKK